MTRLSALLLAGGLSLLAGCAALSPYSELTKLDLALVGSDELNPDLNGRPSPIVVRLIELRHPVTFQNADFFSLYQRPREVLSPDMVVQEELELRAGRAARAEAARRHGQPLRGCARRLSRPAGNELAAGHRAEPESTQPQPPGAGQARYS